MYSLKTQCILQFAAIVHGILQRRKVSAHYRLSLIVVETKLFRPRAARALLRSRGAVIVHYRLKRPGSIV